MAATVAASSSPWNSITPNSTVKIGMVKPRIAARPKPVPGRRRSTRYASRGYWKQQHQHAADSGRQRQFAPRLRYQPISRNTHRSWSGRENEGRQFAQRDLHHGNSHPTSRSAGQAPEGCGRKHEESACQIAAEHGIGPINPGRCVRSTKRPAAGRGIRQPTGRVPPGRRVVRLVLDLGNQLRVDDLVVLVDHHHRPGSQAGRRAEVIATP